MTVLSLISSLLLAPRDKDDPSMLTKDQMLCTDRQPDSVAGPRITFKSGWMDRFSNMVQQKITNWGGERFTVNLLIFSDKNDKKVRKYTIFEIDYKVIFEFNFVFKGAD